MLVTQISENTIIKDEIDYIKFYINIILLVLNIYISHSAKVLLIYYIKYGLTKETHKLLVDKKFCSSIQTVIGLRTELKKKNILIKKEDDKFYLRDEFNINLQNTIIFKWKISKQ